MQRTIKLSIELKNDAAPVFVLLFWFCYEPGSIKFIFSLYQVLPVCPPLRANHFYTLLNPAVYLDSLCSIIQKLVWTFLFLIVDKLIIFLTICYTLYKNPVLKIYGGFKNYSPLKIPTSNALPQWPLIIPQMGLI